MICFVTNGCRLEIKRNYTFKRVMRTRLRYAETKGVLISKDKVRYKNHTVHSRRWEKHIGKDKLKNIVELKYNSYLHMADLFDLERIDTIMWLINLTYKRRNPSEINRFSGDGLFIRQWLICAYPTFQISHISEGELVLSMLMSDYAFHMTLEKVSLKRRFFFDAEPIEIKEIASLSGLVIPKKIDYNSFEEADDASYNQLLKNRSTN